MHTQWTDAGQMCDPDQPAINRFTCCESHRSRPTWKKKASNCLGLFGMMALGLCKKVQ